MSILVVMDNSKQWPLSPSEIGPNVEIVGAKQYITNPEYAARPRAKVFNLCRSYKYQTIGYYVSLLATARGHRPLPAIATIQDLRLAPVIRVASNELEDLIERTLRPVLFDRFELSIYFGHCVDDQFDRLGAAIFGQFPSPFLRASFRNDDGWALEGVRVIGTNDIPTQHRDFALEQARHYFRKPVRTKRSKVSSKFDMAILVAEDDPMPPSNPRAIKKFIAAAESLGMSTETITKDDYGRVGEYDALFIRETTSVNHYTYRFSRRATAEGLIVIDDPESIVRCSNKVYLAELLNRHKLATPKTLVVARDAAKMVVEQIGFPCVVKQPDSAFSAGVMKFDTEEAFNAALPTLFENSELMIAQEFVPTDFDWRIGVLAGQPLFACKYEMAKQHWQIVKRSGKRVQTGGAETLPIDKAPAPVINLAVKAAKLIGDGLYGVDIKVLGRNPVVIEVNDNPNIDAGVEDAILGDFLYERIMRHFLERLEGIKRAR